MGIAKNFFKLSFNLTGFRNLGKKYVIFPVVMNLFKLANQLLSKT